MERHLRTLKKVRGKLLGIQNVVGVGVGYKHVGGENAKEPAIIVYVEKKIPPADLSRAHIVPKNINHLQTDIVEIGTVKMLGVRTGRGRPCQPGVSIGHYQSTAGTLGAIVKDKATGELMVLSNNHVLANGSSYQEVKAKKGDPILQPGPYDGGTIKDRIGVLHRYVPLEKSVSRSDCPVAIAVAQGSTRILNLVKNDYEIRLYKRFKTENTVDCALVKLDAGDLVDPVVLEVGNIKGVSDIGPGGKVLKSGRTSGLTRGVVKSVGTTLQVEMDDEEKVWFSDQVVCDMPSRPGDSGALVLSEDFHAVGLLFAGSEKLTIFNRITNILERLGIEF